MHNGLAILLLVMLGAHVAGKTASRSKAGAGKRTVCSPLLLAGDKPLQPPAEIVPAASARMGVALAVTLGVLAASAGAIAALAELPGRGPPPAALDPMFEEQCGACHLAFPPSLAPTSTWDDILADLQHHFGADATLSAEQVAHLRAWLDLNAAERWDTLPSHLLRVPAADGSLRITGYARLAAHAPAHPGSPVRREAGLPAKQLCGVPRRCSHRPICAAAHHDPGRGRPE